MKFLDTLVAEYRQERKATGDGDILWDDDRGWTIHRGGHAERAPVTFVDFVRGGFRRNAAVAACIREVQTSLSEAPLCAFRKVLVDGGGIGLERIPDHPAEELWNAPNERDPGIALIERGAQHFYLAGNTFIEMDRPSRAGFVERLLPVRPDRVVGARVDDDDIPLAYHVMNADGVTRRTVPAANMIHIPDADPLNAVFGMPRLMAATLEITSDTEASKYVNEILSNHGSPGLIVGTVPEARSEALERAEERFRAKFGGGSGGRGQIAFIAGGMTAREIGFSLHDLEFPDLRRIGREGICATLGVDPRLVGLGSAAGQSNSLGGTEHREARQKLWVQTLIPMLKRWSGYLNFSLAPLFGDIVLAFDISQVQALQDDRDNKFKRAELMSKAAAYTLEDIRRETDHDPDVPIGALLVQPLNMRLVPFGQPPSDEDNEGDTADDDGDDKRARLAAKSQQQRKAACLHVVGWDGMTAGDREACWKLFDAFARAHEPAYDAAASATLRDERDAMFALATQHLLDEQLAERKGVTEDSVAAWQEAMGVAMETYHQRWFDEFEALISHTTEVVGGEVAADLGVSFDLFDPRVLDFIRERALLMQDVPRRTQRAILHSLGEGFANGEPARELAQRVLAIYDDGYTFGNTTVLSMRDRAKLIARTEATAVSNGAALRTQQVSGLNTEKEWLTQGDDRVRDAHASIDGERVPADEPFSNGLDYPQEPNCRCTMLFHVL